LLREQEKLIAKIGVGPCNELNKKWELDPAVFTNKQVPPPDWCCDDTNKRIGRGQRHPEQKIYLKS
jgi:hypothetical protein